jgi:hypothetical protein
MKAKIYYQLDYDIVTRGSVTIDGVWIVNWIYGPLTDRNSSNYSAISNVHTLQITRACTKSSERAFTSRFLVTDLNTGDSSASVLASLRAG